MKADGVDTIEIETDVDGRRKTVVLTKKTARNVAKIIAEDAMSNKLIDASDTEPKSINPGKTHVFEPKAETASTADELQPQVITCPYCESQEIDCLSTEKVTSQLTLFEGATVQTKTKLKTQDVFICEKCGALARLSWREAKKENG